MAKIAGMPRLVSRHEFTIKVRMLAAFMGRMPLTSSENSQPNCTQNPIRQSTSTFAKAFCPSFFSSRTISARYETTSTTPIHPWYAPVVREVVIVAAPPS